MCKSIKYVYWVKKDLFGLVWKVWLYRRHLKTNQLIKITMTITTVLHSRAAPSLLYLLTCLSSNQSECLQASLTSRTTMAVDKSSWAASVRQPWCMAWAMLSLNNDTSIEEHSNLPLIRFPDFGPPLKNNKKKIKKKKKNKIKKKWWEKRKKKGSKI